MVLDREDPGDLPLDGHHDVVWNSVLRRKESQRVVRPEDRLVVFDVLVGDFLAEAKPGKKVLPEELAPETGVGLPPRDGLLPIPVVVNFVLQQFRALLQNWKKLDEGAAHVCRRVSREPMTTTGPIRSSKPAAAVRSPQAQNPPPSLSPAVAVKCCQRPLDHLLVPVERGIFHLVGPHEVLRDHRGVQFERFVGHQAMPLRVRIVVTLVLHLLLDPVVEHLKQVRPHRVEVRLRRFRRFRWRPLYLVFRGRVKVLRVRVHGVSVIGAAVPRGEIDRHRFLPVGVPGRNSDRYIVEPPRKCGFLNPCIGLYAIPVNVESHMGCAGLVGPEASGQKRLFIGITGELN